MIFTFYSFKGGVGRSMALANVARWFQLQGLRVVLIDWDLEAPGLENFFAADAEARASARAKLGVIDLLTTYKEIFPSLPKAQARDSGPSFAEILEGAAPPLAHFLAPLPQPRGAVSDGSGIWLLPAGCRDEQRSNRYADIVQQFNWADFYASFEGHAFFEWMRTQLVNPKLADVVLIDSRTGFAEMSGVCTRHLADVVVVMCAPNDQNLEGVAMMAESFVHRPDVIEARGGRPIRLIMVGSRVDTTEGKPVDVFNARFHELLDRYEPVEFARVQTGFAKLRIPYVSTYAYSEKLTIGEPDSVKIMQEAYASLATHMVLLSEPGSALRQKCLPQLRMAFPQLSEAEVATVLESEVPRVGEFAKRLEAAGIFARALPYAVTDISSVLEGRSRSGKAALVLLVTTATLQQRSLRTLVQNLRSQATGVFLVVLDGPTEASLTAPPGLSRIPTLRLEQDFEQLTRLLQGPYTVTRVPYLAPPPPAFFIGREAELSQVKTLLLTAVRESGAKSESGSIVALVGLGGSGKSSVARALCDDDEIIDVFSDGILWVAADSGADLQAGLAKWVAAFEGESVISPDADETERRLATHLASKACLLVLDGLEDSILLLRIPRGPKCAVLITTRILDVALTYHAQVVEIGALAHEAAVRLALSSLQSENVLSEQEPDRRAIDELVDELGHVPLAIRLASSLLRTRTAAGQDFTGGMRELTESLRTEGLDAFGEDWQSRIGGFSAAIERLSPEDRRQLASLAALPHDKPIALKGGPAGSPFLPTPELAQRLASLSLVVFDSATRTITVPALTHAFLRTLVQRQERADLARLAGTTPRRVSIYISYRRESARQAIRISDRLSKEYGPSSVFLDTERVLPGEDWQRVIQEALTAANVVLVLIGREWLTKRLLDRDDLVRVQVRLALERDISVIPVLLDGVAMPRRMELPDDIAGLAERLALELEESRFNQCLDRLVGAISLLTQRELQAKAAAPAELPVQGAAGVARSVEASVAASAKPGARGSARLSRPAVGGLAAAILLVFGVGFLYVRLGSSGSQTEASVIEPSQAEGLFSQAEDLYFGRTGPRDLQRSMRLYTAAADLGYAPAENALGRMFEYGEGTASNRQEAIHWYSLAAKQGHPDATAALNRLTTSAQHSTSQSGRKDLVPPPKPPR